MNKKISPKKTKGEVEIIKLEEKYLKFMDKYSKLDLLTALTIALSSKLILSKDATKAVERIITSKKRLRNAFGLSESFLVFATQAFIRNSNEELLAENKKKGKIANYARKSFSDYPLSHQSPNEY